MSASAPAAPPPRESDRPVGRPGLVIAGRFQLVGPLGRGAMGEVWKASHVTLGTFVALKLVDTAGVDAEVSARLLVEARAAASIQSPYVAKTFDMGQDGSIAFLAMELLEGEPLDARLARGPLPPGEIARIFLDVSRGVAAAHAHGIVHRDLKPQNIFLAATDSGPIAKVLDFGIAKTTGALRTREGIVVGTPAYLSREQVLGTRPVDHLVDLWALGIVAYECVTGRLPYAATTMAELFVEIAGPSLDARLRDPALPPAFAAWLQRALDRIPEQRFSDAIELGEALGRALMEGAPPTPARRRGVVAMVAGLALVLGLFAAGALVFVATRGQGAAAEPSASPSLDRTPAARAARSASPSVAPVSSASSTSLPSATASAPASAVPSAVPKPGGQRYDPWGF